MRLKDQVCLSVAQMSKSKQRLAPGEEVEDDRGRQQADPEELRRRAAEASADAAGARPTMMGGVGSAITGKKPACPVEAQQSLDREEPPTRGQRVARAVVQLVIIAGDVTFYSMVVVSVMSASRARRREAGQLCCRTCTNRRRGWRGRSARGSSIRGEGGKQHHPKGRREESTTAQKEEGDHHFSFPALLFCSTHSSS